jgi:hypothetical protein
MRSEAEGEIMGDRVDFATPKKGPLEKALAQRRLLGAVKNPGKGPMPMDRKKLNPRSGMFLKVATPMKMSGP